MKNSGFFLAVVIAVALIQLMGNRPEEKLETTVKSQDQFLSANSDFQEKSTILKVMERAEISWLALIILGLVLIRIIWWLVKPRISLHPKSRQVPEGRGLFLNVLATGMGVGYQWRKNGVDIPGETGDSLEIKRVGEGSHMQEYDVVVSNRFFRALSKPAIIEMLPHHPLILEQPQTQMAEQGAGVEFSIGVKSSVPVNLQWRRNGVPLENARNNKYIIDSVSKEMNGSVFDVILKCGSIEVISGQAELRVHQPPMIREESGYYFLPRQGLKLKKRDTTATFYHVLTHPDKKKGISALGLLTNGKFSENGARQETMDEKTKSAVERKIKVLEKIEKEGKASAKQKRDLDIYKWYLHGKNAFIDPEKKGMKIVMRRINETLRKIEAESKDPQRKWVDELKSQFQFKDGFVYYTGEG